jgi:hypothetical protein
MDNFSPVLGFAIDIYLTKEIPIAYKVLSILRENLQEHCWNLEYSSNEEEYDHWKEKNEIILQDITSFYFTNERYGKAALDIYNEIYQDFQERMRHTSVNKTFNHYIPTDPYSVYKNSL